METNIIISDSGMALFTAFAVSLAVSLGLCATKRWHGDFSFDTLIGPQKFHSDPTPRIGGLAIVSGLIAAYFFSGSPTNEIIGPLLIACIPAFIAGIAEDFSKRVRVRTRLLATLSSGVFVCLLTGVAISRVDIPLIDWALQYFAVGVILSMILLAGIVNALNIIDGFNGLAGGVALIIMSTFAALALKAGDVTLASTYLLIACSLLGFLIVNFPFGRIFLGDGGAYFVGLTIGWGAILLIHRNPEISPWAIVLICAYPITEIVYSILRKTRREGYHPSKPDSLHLHMLLHQRVSKKLFAHKSRTMQNSLTSPLAWALALVPCMLAIWMSQSTPALALLAGGFVAAYIAIYVRLTQFRWVRRHVRLSKKTAV